MSSVLVNHSSANDYPGAIEAYNAILGPYDSPPIADLHVSPFLTREKTGSKNRRVIVDLSYPHNQSVNAGVASDIYLDPEFILTLPSIDYITSQICQMGRGTKIYKIDISRAFCHVRIDSGDYNILGLYFNSYYINRKILLACDQWHQKNHCTK